MRRFACFIFACIVLVTPCLAIYQLPSIDNNKSPQGLANWAINAYNQRYGYAKGYYCQIITQDNLNGYSSLYPDYYTSDMIEDLSELIPIQARMCDCVGLIKGYMWYTDGSITVNTSYYPDLTATDLYQSATVSGFINSIPDIPGIIVYDSNTPHVGVYVGNGMVIHTLNFENGTLYQPLNQYTWTHWFELPQLTYNYVNQDSIEQSASIFSKQLQTFETALGWLPSDIVAALIVIFVFIFALAIARIVL